MKNFLAITLKLFGLPLTGIVLILLGFTYDLMFAGIPYQDPTPQMEANYAFHSFIAKLFYGIGALLFFVGVAAIPFIYYKIKRKKEMLQTQTQIQ